MKFKIGIGLVLSGLIMIASALGLFLHNSKEQEMAAEAVDTLMPLIVEQIHTRHDSAADATVPGSTSESPAVDSMIPEMAVVEIDGYSYIGFVGIPSLQLELPVMADWNYPQLQVAPCRFAGNAYADDLVVMAHNYVHHFGNLQKLRVGDLVTFTDMDGSVIQYSVTALDVLDPNAVEDMTAGEYDLTLFTCTYGGKSRVTVRCDRIEN